MKNYCNFAKKPRMKHNMLNDGFLPCWNIIHQVMKLSCQVQVFRPI